MSFKLDRDYVSLAFFLTLFASFTLGFFSIRILLHEARLWDDTTIVALFLSYFILVAVSSSYFGFFYCRQVSERYNLGYLYHLGCFLIFFTTWFVCIMGVQAGRQDHPVVYFSIMLGWGIGIGVHTMLMLRERKNNIRGIQKDEIFD